MIASSQTFRENRPNSTAELSPSIYQAYPKEWDVSSTFPSNLHVFGKRKLPEKVLLHIAEQDIRLAHHRTQAVKLAQATAAGTVDSAGYALFGYFTGIRRTRDFSGCDTMLAGIDVAHTDMNLLVAVLMGTSRMPPESLPSRAEFYERVLTRLSQERGDAEAASVIGRFR